MTAAAEPSGASELFQLFRSGEPVTRAQLAERAGLARSTVAIRLDALLAAGLVIPVQDAVSSGGRPPSRFALNPRSRLIGAVDLGATHATVAVADVTGEILARRSESHPITRGPEASLDWIASVLTELLAERGERPAALAAIGVGLPGPVEHDSGRPANPPIMPGWNDFDVPGGIRDRLGVTALVDNDVNIMALGEQFVAWREVDNLLFVKVATGIGAGIISGGSLQRGAQGVAGDIGHVSVARGEGVVCRCGNSGCLEALASGPAIARSIGLSTSRELLTMVCDGDVAASTAIRQAGRDIGDVLGFAISLINPSVIVLGGSVATAGEQLLAGVREAVYARSAPIATQHLTIAQSKAGADAALIGACMLAIGHALSPRGVDALLA